jgi:hypothetical protein
MLVEAHTNKEKSKTMTSHAWHFSSCDIQKTSEDPRCKFEYRTSKMKDLVGRMDGQMQANKPRLEEQQEAGKT